MKNTTVKDQILKAVQAMPSDVTFDEVMKQIYFLSKMEQGMKQVKAGDTLAHEEVKQRNPRVIQKNSNISDFFRESPLVDIELDLKRDKSQSRRNVLK